MVSTTKKTAKPTRHKLDLSIQFADKRHKALLPRALLRQWAMATLEGPMIVTLRFVDSAESQQLNHDYRGKDYATNVLTFAYTAEALEELGSESNYSGENDSASLIDSDPNSLVYSADIVICSPVIETEAIEQGKTLLAHYAHMLVHGMLHAQGYDHDDDTEADEMETREAEILLTIGFTDPYATEKTNAAAIST